MNLTYTFASVSNSSMPYLVTRLWLIVILTGTVVTAARSQVPESVSPDLASQEGCVSCHKGIENIIDGKMLEAIEERAEDYDDAYGCVICHGGNPLGLTAAQAHAGSSLELGEAGGPSTFYPDPGELTVAKRACGQCHDGYAERLNKSVMSTGAGRYRATMWPWGLWQENAEDRQIKNIAPLHANFGVEDGDGHQPIVGTKRYKAYIAALVKHNPKNFPKTLLPPPVVTEETLGKRPNLAGVTLYQSACASCHLGVPPRQRTGEFRGSGCSACHIPYSQQGLYEGGDIAIDKTRPGRPRVHRIQSSRNAEVIIGDERYTGIPIETCNSCHDRDRVAYAAEGGSRQTANQKPARRDLHHQQESSKGNPKGGLLCQDCHTSIDMHGDGNIPTHKFAQVEIECQDCHGLPFTLPWELPLGVGDEFRRRLDSKPRGTIKRIPRDLRAGRTYKPEDGYLLSARGNPLGNVVRRGNRVILHSATGRDYEVPVLKNIGMEGTYKSSLSKRAMYDFGIHIEKMECYGCHSDLAPVCDKMELTVDHASGRTTRKWLARSGHNDSPTDSSRTRSDLRWNKPPALATNVEGRVGPVMRACGLVATVIGKRGERLTDRRQFLPAGNKVKNFSVQPHSVGRNSRPCKRCHLAVY